MTLEPIDAATATCMQWRAMGSGMIGGKKKTKITANGTSERR